MKFRNRLCILFFVFLWMFPAMVLPVSANSAPPPPYYVFQVRNFPQETVYVDLLIPLTETDERYVPTITENAPESFSQDAEILTYRKDGYCSYTFHYRDALSTLAFDGENNVYYFADTTPYIMDAEDVRFDHADEIYAMGRIRLALLDERGNIVQISPVLELASKEFFKTLENMFYYDALAEEFEVLYQDSPGLRLMYGILCFMGMVFTCIVELFTAALFDLFEKNRKLILLTNVISQMIMYTAYVLLYSVVFWKYESAVILLEILVYSGEALWYSRRIRNVSGKKVFAYTVTANTASLVLGKILINGILT